MVVGYVFHDGVVVVLGLVLVLVLVVWAAMYLIVVHHCYKNQQRQR